MPISLFLFIECRISFFVWDLGIGAPVWSILNSHEKKRSLVMYLLPFGCNKFVPMANIHEPRVWFSIREVMGLLYAWRVTFRNHFGTAPWVQLQALRKGFLDECNSPVQQIFFLSLLPETLKMISVPLWCCILFICHLLKSLWNFYFSIIFPRRTGRTDCVSIIMYHTFGWHF